MGPLSAGPGALHGAPLVRTELAGRFDPEGAGPAEPGAAGDGGDAVTRLATQRTMLVSLLPLLILSYLVDADIAFVAENHLVRILRVRLQLYSLSYRSDC